MHIGQFLILCFLFLLMLYILRLKNLTSIRILIVLLLGLGMLFVFMPELTTKLANMVGFGRGADLILYLLVIFNLYYLVYTLGEQNRLLKMVTLAAREIAILKAQAGEGESLAEKGQGEDDGPEGRWYHGAA